MGAHVHVLTEDETLDAALAGRSLARFGDGELRLAVGRGCSSQRASRRLMMELRGILGVESAGLLACVPRFEATPRRRFWHRYEEAPFADLMRLPEYGSSFITRPDNAPKIDRPDYWQKVRQLWRDKDVVLVTGGKKDVGSFVEAEARSVSRVTGLEEHAYSEIDRIEAAVGYTDRIVLLCLGATATALAARLARKGMHAVDVGHVGMFMRRRGA